ncbi:Mini-ribonuclease 3 [bioreactor metagenome]|uniref:Mini-ribonuclease 3 n=1 Tax=bioreactor metagenome TaxID=1076179 RepID=A0A644TP86_9ZZZZ|nr:ribonuclease III domain-containing protein [Negativicutes bacterium]
MNFDHFQFLMGNMFSGSAEGDAPPAKYSNVEPNQLPALVLAYVGDAFFSLYVRTRLLSYEQNKVRILHNFDAKIVSAAMQAVAYKGLESMLLEEELAIVRRGRNAKSTVPKSATVSEYRYSTGFEAMLGYLYLSKRYERLSEIAERAFVIISREMTKLNKNSGE